MVSTSRRKEELTEFHSRMNRWRQPDLLINPIGTLVQYRNGRWISAPWVEALSASMAGCFKHPETLVTTLSLPAHRSEANIWNLILLESGISAFFGKPGGIWPEVPPINGILNMSGNAFPPNYNPRVYIDCIPDRMISTLNYREEGDHPECAIYWRPSDAMIETMLHYGIPWDDREDELLDVPEVEFAGQPEDIIAILSEAIDREGLR